VGGDSRREACHGAGLADRAGILDTGQPAHFTPHHFRRLLSTDLVGSGLPLHVVATLLGHLNPETTRATAVFPEESGRS
jgi:integrase